MRYFLILFFILLTFVAISAQDDDPIKVDSSIVRLNVGVADKQGRPVIELNKEDFTVTEDGVQQTITNFQTNVTPFSLVLMLDMSGSTSGYRQNIQLAAYRFIDALAPSDRVAVVEFYDKINLLNDFTTNRKSIANSIAVASGTGDTQFFKALNFSLGKLKREGNRRKAIIVLSDGVDTSVKNTDRQQLAKFEEKDFAEAITPEKNEILTQVLNSADALGVTIYPIALPSGDPKRLADPTPAQFAMFNSARKRLDLIAMRSGGTLYAINRLDELGKFFAQAAANLRSLYTIEYQPSNDKRDGKFRTIKMVVKDPQLIVKTRQGYISK
jgi:Ca-activated chloride channel homolog